MKKFSVVAAIGASVMAVFSAPTGPVRFESKPHPVITGMFPQVAVRVTGDVSLLAVEGGDLWYRNSPDGGDSFPGRVRVNDTPHDVTAHGENFPILIIRSMREFYILWQARTPEHEGTALKLSRSTDWGASFAKPVAVDAGSQSEGFYTMAISPKGTVYAAWLDGRERGGEGSGLYLARSTDRGATFEKSVRVAGGVCPCCRPSLAFGHGDAVYVSWRSVAKGDVRDIHVASSPDGGTTWSKPSGVAEDNWHLNACPHSGASLAVIGTRLFVAWHTVREGTSQLYLAWSDDGGKSFSQRTNLRGGVLDSNHVALVAHGGKIGAVFQGRDPQDNEGWGKQNAYYREIDAKGNLSDLQKLGHLDGSVNYPELLYEDPDHVFIIWHENGEEQSRIVMIRGRVNGAASTNGGNHGN
jgi:hypothetical protein